MRALAWSLCLIIGLTSAPIAAQPASSALSEATKLLGEGEFERALKRLDGALLKTKDASEIARLQVARGQCLLALGKHDRALEAFSAALKKDVNVALPDFASPDAAALFRKALSSYPATLSVTVNVAASVRVGDRSLGPAPLTAQVEPGTLIVEATTSDGRSSRQSVDLKPGSTVTIALEIAAPPAVLETPPPPPPSVSEPTVTPPQPLPIAVTETPRRSRVGWIPLGAGVAVAAAGGISLWQARVQYDRLADASRPPMTSEEMRSAVGTGTTLQTVGWVGVGVGAAAIAAGAVMLALPPKSESPELSIGLAPGGAFVAVSGVLP